MMTAYPHLTLCSTVTPHALNNIESGVMLLDSERRVQFWNQWLVRYTGVSAVAAQGKRLEVLFSENLPSVLLDAVQDACEKRLSRLLSQQLHPKLFPVYNQLASGEASPIFHSVVLRPLQDEQQFTLVQLHDTTSAVKRERHLREKEHALRKAHQALSEEKQFIDTVLETISALVIVTDSYHRIVNTNRSTQLYTGLAANELQGQSLKMVLGLESLKHLPELRNDSKEIHPFTCRMITPYGEQVHIRWAARAVQQEQADSELPRYLIYTGQDITEQERADALLRLEREMLEMGTAGETSDSILNYACLTLEQQLDSCRVAVVQLDAMARLQVRNGPGLPESFSEQLMQMPTGMLMRQLHLRSHVGELMVFSAQYNTVAQGGVEEQWLALARRYKMAACWLMPVQMNHQVLQNMLAVFPRYQPSPQEHQKRIVQRIGQLMTLILDRQQQQEQIQYLALHDPLTGLANRSLLNEHVNSSIHRADRLQQSFALLFIDLDGFKAINDNYGHDAGDALLITIAHRLEERVRGVDCCARIGGDEFVILFDEVASQALAVELAQSLLALIAKPLPWSGEELQVSASIGVALYPRDGDSAGSLLIQADHAMYHAKASGKNQVSLVPEL